jgi:hypothetical protein
MARPRKNAQIEPLLRAALEGLDHQRQRIEEQIGHVRSLLGSGGVRRGRPPGSKNKKRAVGGNGAEGKILSSKRVMSAAARKRMSAAQRRRWAERRKATSGKEE